jgi:uncharacterized protein YukE
MADLSIIYSEMDTLLGSHNDLSNKFGELTTALNNVSSQISGGGIQGQVQNTMIDTINKQIQSMNNSNNTIVNLAQAITKTVQQMQDADSQLKGGAPDGNSVTSAVSSLVGAIY